MRTYLFTVHLTICSYHVMYVFQLASLAKSLSVRLRTKWLWVRIPLQPIKTWDISPVWSKEFQATIESGFTLKHVRDMIRTCTQMHHTDKYSQHSSVIWPVWLNGLVFVDELSGCGFKSRWSHLNFRYRACLEQGVPWNSGNYIVYIHSETLTWHDKNLQLNLMHSWHPAFLVVSSCKFVVKFNFGNVIAKSFSEA